MQIDPTNIDQFIKILLSYKSFLDKRSKDLIDKMLHDIISKNLSLKHSFEICWALWAFKTFKIKCDSLFLSRVLASREDISMLIALDLIESNLYRGKKPKLGSLMNAISSNDLFTEHWLFTYESIKKGWLKIGKKKIIEGNAFMKILYDNNIEFYDDDKNIEVEFEIKPASSMPHQEIGETASVGFQELFKKYSIAKNIIEKAKKSKAKKSSSKY